ncbi:MAG TPA: DinB family protein [Vicinamibacterales bacterium]|nr:DinB family protein [Vicinamibacterales bacterium]
MRLGIALVVGSVLAVAASSNAVAQGRGGAPACTTVACDVQGDWGRGYALLIGVAEAMPEDKFGAKPTPAQESFGQRLMHVANIDLKLVSTLGGKTPAPMVNPKAASKAEIVAALRQVSDYGSAVLKEFNDQQLAERVTSMPFLGPTASRLRVIYFAMTHSQDIYGQLVVYLRLNGITPPASNRP